VVVGEHDSPTKLRLIQPLFSRTNLIFTLDGLQMKWIGDEPETLVESEHELAVFDVVLDDAHGEDRHKETGPNRTQQDDRQPKLVGSAHFLVIAISVAGAVVVGEQRIAYIGVGVRSSRIRYDRHCGKHALPVPDAAISVDDSSCLVADLQRLKFGPHDDAMLGNDFSEPISQIRLWMRRPIHAVVLLGDSAFLSHLDALIA